MGKKPKNFMFRKTALDFLEDRLSVLPFEVPVIHSENQLRELIVGYHQQYDAYEFTICIEKIVTQLVRQRAGTTEGREQYQKYLRIMADTYLKDCGAPGFTDEKGVTHFDAAAHFMDKKLHLMPFMELWRRNGRINYFVDPTLCDMLQLTKLDKMPLKAVELPFRMFTIIPGKELWHMCTKVGEKQNDLWEMNCGTEEYPLDSFFWAMDEMTWYIVRLRRTTKDVVMAESTFSLEKFSTVGDILATQDNDADRASLEFALAVAIYITTKDADIILAENSPEYRKWAKSIAHLPPGHKKAQGTRRYLARATGKYLGINRHGYQKVAAPQNGTHASPVTHWRCGHMRSQKKGPLANPYWENVYIKPTLVGGVSSADSKPRVLR